MTTTPTLARLRELHEAATPGSWIVEGDEISNGVVAIASVWDADDPENDEEVANARLIVEYRNTIPTLLDELERQAAEITELRGARDSLFAAIEHGDDEHRAWLKDKIDQHFARTALKAKP